MPEKQNKRAWHRFLRLRADGSVACSCRSFSQHIMLQQCLVFGVRTTNIGLATAKEAIATATQSRCKRPRASDWGTRVGKMASPHKRDLGFGSHHANASRSIARGKSRGRGARTLEQVRHTPVLATGYTTPCRPCPKTRDSNVFLKLLDTTALAASTLHDRRKRGLRSRKAANKDCYSGKHA